MNFRRIALFSLSFTATGFAQITRTEPHHQYIEGHVQGMMKSHGLDERNRKAQSGEDTAVDTLTPLLGWLQSRFGRVNTKPPVGTSLRSLDEPIEVIVREDDASKVFNGVWVHIRLLDTNESAGRAAAIHLSLLSVPFERGSFSGLPVGDWTAKNLYARRPALMFTRRNAFVRVICQTAIEVWKSDKSMRGVSDAGVNDMCEGLARDIDAQIQELPAKKRE